MSASDVAKSASDIDGLIDDYLTGMPALGSGTARIAVGLWRHLAEGAPVARDALADRLGLSRKQVDEALDGPLSGTYLEDDDGRVRAFWGLSLPDQPSPHRLRLGDQTLYAWCAPDSLFLPLLLGRTLTVESTLTTTDEQITLLIDPDRLADIRAPDDTVVSFVPMTPEGLGTSVPSILSTFCHHMLFFPDAASGTQCAREHNREDLVFLGLRTAFDGCQRLYRALLGDALDDDQPR